MSARKTAGIAARSGRRPATHADHYITKQETSALKDQVADFLRASGLAQPRLRKPEFGREKTKQARQWKRKGPHRAWQPRFLVAYRRTGQIGIAAKVARVSVNTVKTSLYSDRGVFLHKCQQARGQWVWRQVYRISRQEGKQLTFGRRQLAALVGYLLACGVPLPGARPVASKTKEKTQPKEIV